MKANRDELTCVAYFMIVCSLSKAMFLSFPTDLQRQKKRAPLSATHTPAIPCVNTWGSMSHVKTALFYLNTNRNDF